MFLLISGSHMCVKRFSLSIKRFWGKGGKMEAKKGES